MIPAVEVAGARVFLGDCRDVLKGLPDNSVDSIVTDPPYGLGFMGKKWDTFGGKAGISESVAAEIQGRYREKAPGTPRYAGTARPAKPSDGEMLAFQLWCTEWAVECLRVLKPGGHILAFGGSRTWHRLAVAVEDAGFELRDSIAWIYGSGFPKSLDVSKAIDKAAGAEREVSGITKGAGIGGGNTFTDDNWKGIGRDHYERFDVPASEEAQKWQGWGTALKPAFEPVVVGRKPLVGTVAENVLQWGVGGLNIDGSRIRRAHDDVSVAGNRTATFGTQETESGGDGSGGWSQNDAGRWPANVILDEVSAGLLDEQSGVSVSKVARRGLQTSGQAGGLAGENPNYNPDTNTVRGHGDTGGASRFFYVAKASKRDRNEGLEELDAVRHADSTKDDGVGGENPRNRTNQARQNFHPTVKPTRLMRYLIKLVTPAGGVVLDPFTGSGSTGKAALLDGYQFIGAELTEEYLPIIEGRLRWAAEQEGEDDGKLF